MTRRAVGFADPPSRWSPSSRRADRGTVLEPGSRIEVVRGGVLVDVDFCATHLHNTGIQRVVRQTMARWDANRDIRLVAWTSDGGAMRALTPVEHRRVIAFNSAPEPAGRSGDAVADLVLVVPFESVVVLPEVPQLGLCDPRGARRVLGQPHRPRRLRRDPGGLRRHGARRGDRALRALPHGREALAPRRRHQRGGHGRVRRLRRRGRGPGLTPPSAVEVTLPIGLPDDVSAHSAPDDVPLVLCVGSQEGRKNHLAILFAAEMLWREGLDFRLRFIGGGSLRSSACSIAGRRAAPQGRRVEVLRGVDDAVLLSSYAEARFTVFPSLHEGYGLPVAESLAHGVPVVTSDYGSTAEIAVDGGCLTVDPRDDDAIIEAMRSLLVDDVVLDRLVPSALRAPSAPRHVRRRTVERARRSAAGGSDV